MGGRVREVDVAVIGAGSAGLNARREALENGAKSVVLIEGTAYGTTCARVGCMPSKLLIQAADAAHEARHADRFGVRLPEAPVIDAKAVFERVRSERDRFVGFVLRSTEAIPAEERLWGRARFVGPTSLELDDGTRVEARAVVIATGSSPWLPPPFRGIRDRILTNDDVFELDRVPRTLAVIGAGVIALELGQALSRLGAQTKVLTIDRMVGPLQDPEVRERARELLGAELPLEAEAEVLEARDEGAHVLLRWRDADGREHEERFEDVLVATGRRPNVAGLGLETTGLALGPTGVPEFDPTTMQCGDAPVFLAGDVTGMLPVLHEASDEGRIAGRNAGRWPDVRPVHRRAPLAVVFTDPQMAVVGVPFSALPPDEILVGEIDFARQGRARVMGQNRGLARVYADRATGRLVGAEMIGPRVENMAHLLAWAVQQGLTVGEALNMPFYHPVVEEGLRTALREIGAELGVVELPDVAVG